VEQLLGEGTEARGAAAWWTGGEEGARRPPSLPCRGKTLLAAEITSVGRASGWRMSMRVRRSGGDAAPREREYSAGPRRRRWRLDPCPGAGGGAARRREVPRG
jgi:hypothetical protein